MVILKVDIQSAEFRSKLDINLTHSTLSGVKSTLIHLMKAAEFERSMMLNAVVHFMNDFSTNMNDVSATGEARTIVDFSDMDHVDSIVVEMVRT